jgi:hypothetical protein
LVIAAGIGLWLGQAWAEDGTPGNTPAKSSAAAADTGAEREICCPPNLKQRLKPLSQIRAEIELSPGPRPMDCTASVFDVPASDAGCRWTPIEFQWCPTDFHLHPPYFEETPVERYGQTPCPALQPALSTAHFFTALTTLPYRMLIDRPCEPVYTLGYYRPGSPTPCLRQGLPCPRDRQP